MKTIIILLLTPILLFSNTAHIKGKVINRDTTFIMKGTSIILIGDKTFHTVTDEKATYELNNIPTGKYIIKCECVGFITKIEEIEIRENNLITLKDFYLEVEPIKNENEKIQPHIEMIPIPPATQNNSEIELIPPHKPSDTNYKFLNKSKKED